MTSSSGPPDPPSVATQDVRLYLRTHHSPARTLAIRVAVLAGVLLLLVAVLWWDRDGLHDHLDGHVSFGDVLYFTAVSVTTVGYGDIVPVSGRARLIDATFVTPVRLFVWLMFLGTAYQLLLQKWIERWRMKRMHEGLSDHVVVCGFGHSGQSAGRELSSRGIKVMVMDRDEAAVQAAADAGYIGLLSDPTRQADLRAAAVTKAAAVLLCLGRDDSAVLAVLTIRNLCPHVRIVAQVRDFENLQIIRQAGADATVLPSQVGGYLMADAMRTNYINDYVTDMLTSSGRVRLHERPARAEEVGRRMRDIEPDLVLRLYRDGAPVGFWEGPTTVIREHDTLLVIAPTDKGTT